MANERITFLSAGHPRHEVMNMHRGHPLLCGTLLGLTWTLLSLLFQGADWLTAWSLEREGAALLGRTRLSP